MPAFTYPCKERLRDGTVRLYLGPGKALLFDLARNRVVGQRFQQVVVIASPLRVDTRWLDDPNASARPIDEPTRQLLDSAVSAGERLIE